MLLCCLNLNDLTFKYTCRNPVETTAWYHILAVENRHHEYQFMITGGYHQWAAVIRTLEKISTGTLAALFSKESANVAVLPEKVEALTGRMMFGILSRRCHHTKTVESMLVTVETDAIFSTERSFALFGDFTSSDLNCMHELLAMGHSFEAISSKLQQISDEGTPGFNDVKTIKMEWDV